VIEHVKQWDSNLQKILRTTVLNYAILENTKKAGEAIRESRPRRSVKAGLGDTRKPASATA
jgi:hypothetical protein